MVEMLMVIKSVLMMVQQQVNKKTVYDFHLLSTL
jgi:hypothetical protein